MMEYDKCPSCGSNAKLEWQPIETAPRFKVIEVGGWYISGTTTKIWMIDIARKGLFSWGGNFSPSRHTHWRDVDGPPKALP